MKWLINWVRAMVSLVSRVPTIEYVGIATISAATPFYRRPDSRGKPIGTLSAGQYFPHFTATADRTWLEIMLLDGSTAWLPKTAAVTVTEPDPNQATICLDPGHGGSDSGATAPGIWEKWINLSIAEEVAQRLRAAGNPVGRVWMTRTGDADVSLGYRSALANAAGSHLFICIHNNAFNLVSRGTETYYKCGSEALDAVREQSKRAACLTHQAIEEQISSLCGQPDCDWEDRGVICRRLSSVDPRSYYYVLRHTEGPAILIEYLFVSNPGDAQCLLRPAFRACLAEATCAGICRFLAGEAPQAPCWFRELEGL